MTYVFEDSFENVEGYRVHVRASHPAGRQTVILVPGIGVSEKYYRRLASHLVKSCDVIAIDLPGYGKAEKPKTILDLKQLATVLRAFIIKRDIDKPILVGQSMGCQIITHMAALHPDTASKLILLSPTINDRERSALKQLWRLLQDVTREPLPGNLIVLKQYLKFGIRRFLVTQRYMIADQPETMLPDINLPVLIIRGTQDVIVPHAWAQQLARVTPQGSFRELERGTHNFHWKYPEETAQLCRAFIIDS